MSDRKNRDVGRKRTRQGCNYCGCWHCMCDAEKKRIVLEKSKRNDLIDAADMMAGDGGYSEGTQEAYDEFVKTRNYQVICPKCGVDRLKVDCPNPNRLDCGIKVEAQ